MSIEHVSAVASGESSWNKCLDRHLDVKLWLSTEVSVPDTAATLDSLKWGRAFSRNVVSRELVASRVRMNSPEVILVAINRECPRPRFFSFRRIRVFGNLLSSSIGQGEEDPSSMIKISLTGIVCRCMLFIAKGRVSQWFRHGIQAEIDGVMQKKILGVKSGKVYSVLWIVK